MKKILVVDDSELVRRNVRVCLEKAGYQVLEGSTGVEGLSLSENNPDINLIISDINMPEMDGLAMCMQLRSKPEFQQVPILILTTEGTQALKDRGRAVGVRGWIVKPFDSKMLLLTVQKLAGDAA